MMIATPTPHLPSAAPQPRPGRPDTSANRFELLSWQGADLVRTSAVDTDLKGHAKSKDFTYHGSGAAQPLKATSLAAAMQTARSVAYADWTQGAVAVLQATDGAYYAMGLFTDDRWSNREDEPYLLQLEPHRRGRGDEHLVTTPDVTALNTAVKAVVGRTSWVDFSTASQSA